jgi:hypothetical protein
MRQYRDCCILVPVTVLRMHVNLGAGMINVAIE